MNTDEIDRELVNALRATAENAGLTISEEAQQFFVERALRNRSSSQTQLDDASFLRLARNSLPRFIAVIMAAAALINITSLDEAQRALQQIDPDDCVYPWCTTKFTLRGQSNEAL